MNRVRKLIPLFVVVFFWLIDLVSKIKYNGLMFGFDYGLFHPDGQLYTFRTLTSLGHSQQEAGSLVSNWYATHSYKLQNFSPNSLFYQVNPQWGRFMPRVLYPFLSIPFVYFFGIRGMLVIPALSMLTTMLCVYFIGKCYRRTMLGALVAVSLSLSITINRWMFINTTDSLLVGLTSLVAVWLVCNKKSHFQDALLVFLILATSFTRMAFLEWIAIGTVYFFRVSKLRGVVTLIVSGLAFIPSVLGNTSTEILPNSSARSLPAKILSLPTSFFKVGFYEMAELAALDRFFLVLIIFSVLVSVMYFKRTSSQYFLAMLLALWITASINGTVGTNFRYELPIIVFMGWVICESGLETLRGVQIWGRNHERLDRSQLPKL